jgi:hypothetical protein
MADAKLVKRNVPPGFAVSKQTGRDDQGKHMLRFLVIGTSVPWYPESKTSES